MPLEVNWFGAQLTSVTPMVFGVTVDAIPVRTGNARSGTPNEIVAPEVSGYVMHPTGTEAAVPPELLAIASGSKARAVMSARSGAGVLIAVMPWRTQGQVVASPGDQETANTEQALPKTGYATVLRDRRFLYFLLAMLPVEMVFFQSLAAMPLFVVRDLHVSEAGFGMLLAINTVMIILTEVPLNTAMSTWSHRQTIALGALLVGAGFGGLALGGGAMGVAITVVIWTVGEMILLPASSAYVSDLAPPELAGAYMGLYTMGFSLAFAIGPWLGVQVLEKLGPASIWLGALGCGCITALMIWFQKVERTA